VLLNGSVCNNGVPIVQAIVNENFTKIKKSEKTKSLSTKSTASISKSTNDLTISHIPVSNKPSTSSIPIVLTSSLDKSKSKSVSSLKKSEKSDTETRSLKDLTKTSQRNLKKKESVKKASSTSSERKSFNKIDKNSETKLKQTEVEANKKPTNKTQTNIEKTFKRTIINKKLPVRLNLKNKHSSEKLTASKTEITLGINKKQADADSNNKSEKTVLNQLCTSQKREIVLYKDDNLGFGFIAGSEKPLVVRFVTPG